MVFRLKHVALLVLYFGLPFELPTLGSASRRVTAEECWIIEQATCVSMLNRSQCNDHYCEPYIGQGYWCEKGLVETNMFPLREFDYIATDISDHETRTEGTEDYEYLDTVTICATYKRCDHETQCGTVWALKCPPDDRNLPYSHGQQDMAQVGDHCEEEDGSELWYWPF